MDDHDGGGNGWDRMIGRSSGKGKAEGAGSWVGSE